MKTSASAVNQMLISSHNLYESIARLGMSVVSNLAVLCIKAVFVFVFESLMRALFNSASVK